MTPKEERLASLCAKRKCDGVWIRRRANIAWLTDGADVHCDAWSDCDAASLLWSPRKKIVLTEECHAERLAKEELGDDWEYRTTAWYEKAPSRWNGYISDMPNDQLVDLRTPMTELELKRIRQLGVDVAYVVCSELKQLQPGMTEHEVAGLISGSLRTLGIFTPVILVGADDRMHRFPQPIPTDKPIRKKVQATVCGRRHGLTVAMTRMVCFGKPSNRLVGLHEAACRVHQRMHEATLPGARYDSIIAASAVAYADVGQAEEWAKLDQGGPIGYACRDFIAMPKDARRIREAQALAWNPTVGGVRSEDTILSTRELLTWTDDWPMLDEQPDILVL